MECGAKGKAGWGGGGAGRRMRGIKEKRVVFLLSQPPWLFLSLFVVVVVVFLSAHRASPSPLSDLLDQAI